MDLIFHIIPLFGVLALLYTFWRSSWITKQDAGNEKMQIIAGHIAEGAMAFLKAEYRVLIFLLLWSQYYWHIAVQTLQILLRLLDYLLSLVPFVRRWLVLLE